MDGDVVSEGASTFKVSKTGRPCLYKVDTRCCRLASVSYYVIIDWTYPNTRIHAAVFNLNHLPSIIHMIYDEILLHRIRTRTLSLASGRENSGSAWTWTQQSVIRPLFILILPQGGGYWTTITAQPTINNSALVIDQQYVLFLSLTYTAAVPLANWFRIANAFT